MQRNSPIGMLQSINEAGKQNDNNKGRRRTKNQLDSDDEGPIDVTNEEELNLFAMLDGGGKKRGKAQSRRPPKHGGKKM
jgi:hypothetical protein